MATPVINQGMDNVITSLGQVEADLKSLVPITEKIGQGAMAFKDSGSIVSFTDSIGGFNLNRVTTKLEPIQDLHGQASPYPAGGGTNLIEYPAVNTTTNGVAFSTTNGKLNATGTATANAQPYSSVTVTSYATMNFGPYPAGTYTVKSTFPSVPGATRAVV